MRRHRIVAIAVFIFFQAAAVMAYEFNPGISLSLSEEYNDNIFLGHSDRKSDFITYVSPGAYLSLRSAGGSEFRVDYSPSFNYYASQSGQNNTSHNASARGSFILSEKTNLRISDAFVLSKELRDLRTLTDFGPIRSRTEVRVNTLRGDISHKLGGHFSLLLGGSYIDTEFKDPGFNAFKAYSGTAGLGYRINERSNVSANAGYAKYDYNLSNDADIQDYTLALTHRITPTLTLGVTGGAALTKIEHAGKWSANFSGGIELRQQIERGSAVLSLRQLVEPGLEEGRPLRTLMAGLRLTGSLTELWTVSLSSSYNTYKSINTPDTDVDMVILSAELTYNIRRWAGLALSYSYVDYNDRRSRTGDYYDNRAALTLRVHYDKRQMQTQSDQERLSGP